MAIDYRKPAKIDYRKPDPVRDAAPVRIAPAGYVLQRHEEINLTTREITVRS